MNSMSRERKKNQLKRQIVPAGTPLQEEEDSQEIVRKAHQKVVRRRMLILFLILFSAGCAAFALLRYDRYHQYTDYQVIWEKNLTGANEADTAGSDSGFCGYVDFAEGVLKYTKDGASYIDARGKVIWIQSYEMKSPVVSVNGNFAVIGDQQGNSIYICSTSGCQGQATAILPIQQVSVSAKGVAAVLEEDSRASYIYLYKKDGSSLDISVKSLLSGDGYPVDISLSPGGTQWITSFMYLEQGMIRNKVVFYNFGLGKNDPRRVVGVFLPKDLAEALAGRVRFLDDSHAVIFTDKGLQFFSTRVETSPESTGQILFDEKIRSISYTEQYVGVVTDNSASSDPYCLKVFTADGKSVFEVPFSYQYTGFDIDGDQIFLYNDSSCRVYNMKGTEKFNGIFDFTVSKVSAGRFPGTVLVMGPQMMTEIKLQ